MKQTIKGVILGAAVAAGVSVLLAQTPTWTTPRTWATDDLLTAGEFNTQFRDNLEWLRQDATLTGTDALDDLGCGTRGTDEVLYSDCDWAALPAGVVFDIHDDVGTAATIADADRLTFSDESVNDDPMRYTLASNLADYMQGEVELSADRITSDTLSVDRIPNLPASKLPAPPAVTIDALGCNGTPSADTFLRGDCEWAELPTTVVVALDMDNTSTTASAFQNASPTATLPSIPSGQSVTAYVVGLYSSTGGGSAQCSWRLINTTTGTELARTDQRNAVTFTGLPIVDTSPSTTADNVYVIQIRATSTIRTCHFWAGSQDPVQSIFEDLNGRGFIAVVTG